ncbi:unnamed protein product, partial [Symbiodinium microadriaticum]
VTLHRKLALLKLQLLIKRTEKEEKSLHDNMHPSVAKVMRGKKLGAKHRPIDDACQSQTNAAYSATIKLELHNADYIACIALLIAKKIKGGEQRFGSGEWTGKCLDLTKAYKQIALHPSHRDLCVTYFKGADGKDRFYLPNSLMFGASVLKVPSAVYFDDFPLFTPVEGAEAMDEAVSQFLSLLGWDHARTGAKGKPCAPAFDVLGMTLDLSKVNSPEAITRHQVQVLHGSDFDHSDKEPQLICHIELFVIVAVRWIFRDQFLNRRLLLFVDNEASRFAILKGGSGSRGMNNLIRAFDSLDVTHPCFYWLDRVPSFSNVADGPSRQDSDLAVRLLSAHSVEDFTWPQGLEEMIVAERKRKGEIRA